MLRIMSNAARTLVCLFALPTIALLSACGASGGRASAAGSSPETRAPGPETRLAIPAGRYAEAFDHARDALRDWKFTLERVDAQAGVIATQQKGTGGLATPWDQEQSTLAQEAEDTIQRQKRAVRVEFVGTGPDAGTLAEPGADVDLRRAAGPLEMRVTVDVYRWQQAGWRLNTQAILYSTYSRDPQADSPDVQGGRSYYGVAVGRDDALAARLAAEVGARLDGAPRR